MRLPRFSPLVREDLSLLRRGLRLIHASAPRYVAAAAVVALLEALLPAAHVWLLKQIIDSVAARAHSPLGAGPVSQDGLALGLAGAYFLLVCLQQSLRSLSGLLDGHIYDLIGSKVTLKVMQKASAYPDLTPFESPRFYDRLQLLQEEVAWQPTRLLMGFARLAQSGLLLGCMLFFLARFHLGVLLVLVLAAGPSVFFQRRLQEAIWCQRADLVPMRRRLLHYTEVLLSAPFAKEVRLFGFADYFLGRYQRQFDELMARVGPARRRAAGASVALSLLAALGVGGAFAYVIGQALRGALTLGDLALYTGALFQTSAAAAGVAGGLGQIYGTLPCLRVLFAFLDSTPAVPAATEGQKVTAPRPVASCRSSSVSRSGFRLEQVAFRYPDAERPVFEELELEIPWGQTTALVGENGAGKSTLVKLLTRLFDPATGRVFLNDIDLRSYDIEDLRRQVAVVFQDYARYQMPVWENIGLGDVSRLNDRQQIAEAARRGGAEAVIRRLPLGEETMLGREFEGGVELSGGEWQKIALARAFMRDAPILILDEPTAALDARSEYEVYRRFLELAAGRTTLLISHRFSTVRMADRILVLEDGGVIEEGDHLSLVARGGRYAELFSLQAERYR